MTSETPTTPPLFSTKDFVADAEQLAVELRGRCVPASPPPPPRGRVATIAVLALAVLLVAATVARVAL